MTPHVSPPPPSSPRPILSHGRLGAWDASGRRSHGWHPDRRRNRSVGRRAGRRPVRQPVLRRHGRGTHVGTTVAHCAVNYRTQPSSSPCRDRGRVDLRTATGTEVPVSEVIIHPAFDRAARRNDFGSFVCQPAQRSGCATHVQRRRAHLQRVDDRHGGRWGSITPDGNTAVDEQRSATVPVFTDTTCTGFIGTFLADNQVCAGANGVGVCTGDSGGPLFVADTKGTTLAAS